MGNDFIVPPLSRWKIEDHAWNLRCALGLEDVFEFPVIEVVETILPDFGEAILGWDFDMEVKPDNEVDTEAYTTPDGRSMVLRESTYLGALEGWGRDRFTIAHELGHVLMHANVPLRRVTNGLSFPRYRSAEWQANYFGGAILAPHRTCNNLDEDDLVMRCGMSQHAASVRRQIFRQLECGSPG